MLAFRDDDGGFENRESEVCGDKHVPQAENPEIATAD